MSNSFCLQNVDEDFAADVKADVRMQMFFALRKAVAERKSECSFSSKELGDAMGKDPGFISRVLSGTSKGITAETLAVFLTALRYELRMVATKDENVSISNHNRPCEVPHTTPIKFHSVTMTGSAWSMRPNIQIKNPKFAHE